MNQFIVLYRTASMSHDDAPYGFFCQASSFEQAEIQCLERIPQAQIVWTTQDMTYAEALEDFDCNEEA